MIKTLLAVRFRGVLSRLLAGKSGGAKRSNGTKILMVFLILYCVVVFFGMMTALFSAMCNSLAEAGLSWFYFALMWLLAFVLCFIGSIFAAQSQLFEAKDNALLLSMPIKPASILISRIAGLLLLDYMYEAIVVLPAGIIWAINQPVTAVGVIFFVIAVVIMPGLALTLSCLFGWLVALVSSKLKRKNIVSLVFSLALLFAYLAVYSKINTYVQMLIVNGAQIAEAVQKAVFPAYHLGVAVAEGNVLSFLIYAACMIVPFAIVCALLARNFISIATASKGSVRIEYRERAVKTRSARAALVSKELHKFWSSPMYIMNSSLGAIFTIVGVVALVIKRGDVLAVMAAFPAIAPATLLCAALCLVTTMNFVSAPALSLEGKSLWLPKSLPVSPADVLLAKAQAHQTLCIPPLLLAAIVCAVCFGATLVQILLLIIVPGIVTVCVSYFGVFINLHFPRFDYANDTQAVKQGAAGVITMFASLAAVALPMVLYFFLLSQYISAELFLALAGVLYTAIAFLLYRYLKTGGSRVFESL